MAIIADKGGFHCTLFLFFFENHRVTSGFASSVNTNSQKGLDGSFWNNRWVGRAVLKSWLRPWCTGWPHCNAPTFRLSDTILISWWQCHNKWPVLCIWKKVLINDSYCKLCRSDMWPHKNLEKLSFLYGKLDFGFTCRSVSKNDFDHLVK